MRIVKLLAVFYVLVACLPIPGYAQGTLNVVATSSSTGMLVREIAGEHAALTILAPPDRDLHTIQARPSMIRALRGADLLLATGADLEVGWLPVAIRQSANPKILPGKPGYFESAAQVELLEKNRPADRSLGDVHPVGNPHISMDPIRMARVAVALAERLAELHPAAAETFLTRAKAFQARAERRVAAWQQQLQGDEGVVTYHKDVIYLLDRLEVPLLGTIESTPGVPPTAMEIRTLTGELKGRTGVVLATTYQPAGPSKMVARELGWSVKRLPLEPPLKADGEAYLGHLDQWVAAITQAGS
ncbi:MAG: zinc ABC transporter substrate-binding protein [Pseudomonadota bacterium]|nr:zinc ABC transporter substrate-binding protein [Pseudomonadota bacterium]